MDPLARGVLKWCITKKASVNGKHIKNTPELLNALKHVVVSKHPKIFTAEVLHALTVATNDGDTPEGPAPVALQTSFDDIFQDKIDDTNTPRSDTNADAPEQHLPDALASGNHVALFKRFLEDETMMLRLTAFVNDLDLASGWKWKIGGVMEVFMKRLSDTVNPENDLMDNMRLVNDAILEALPADYITFAELVAEFVFGEQVELPDRVKDTVEAYSNPELICS